MPATLKTAAHGHTALLLYISQLGRFKILAPQKTAAHRHTAQQLNHQSSLKYSPLQKQRHTGTQLFYSMLSAVKFEILDPPKTAAFIDLARC
jgi:hypothetical protein